MKRFLLLSGILIFLSLLNKHQVLAQKITEYDFNAATETYNEITGGNLVPGSSTDDDKFYSNRSIGFDFFFAGQVFNEIGVSTNGFASFSNAADNIFYPLESDINNSISPLGGDLDTQANSSITTSTTGTAPNRVFTIQWKNYTWYGLSANYNFQIKLYEIDNSIVFHYGNCSHPAGNNRTAQVGVYVNDSDFVNRVGANNNWNTTNTSNSTNLAARIPLQINIRPTNELKFTYSPIPTDLGINILPDVAALCGEQEYNYTIEVNNSSATSNTNIEVDFPIPSGASFSSYSSSAGTYDDTAGLFTIDNLESNTTATLEVNLTVDPGMEGSTITANAQILDSDAGDPDLSNNITSVDLAVNNNSSPQLSDINNQSVAYNNVSVPIGFTISDAETAADDLIISVTSSNQTLIPNSNIAVNGTGTNREILLEPGLNQFGTSIITVEVSDGSCAIIKSFEIEVFKQTFSNFEEASVVVGQADFTSGSTTASEIVAPGSNSSAVSVKGVLAVGSQTTNRVLIWNAVPSSNGAPANIVIGQTNFTNDNPGTSQSELRNPDGVNFSPDGNKLLVADAGNNRILIWNSIPTSNNEPADIVLGQNSFNDNGAGTSATQFNRPTDIQFTASGKMIVTDRNNDRVLIYNKIPTQNNTAADVVIGQADFTSGFQGIGNDRLRIPWNTSVAPDGKLLIADDGNNRVLIYNSIPTANGAAADFVIGQNDFNSGGQGTGDDGFSSPGVTVSPNGVVAVADFRNHRGLIFNEIPTSNGASADFVLGQPDFNETFEFNNGVGGSGTPTNRNMSQPYGINFDLNERLYINGRGMNRMMIFGDTPIQSTDLSISFNSDSNSPCINSLVSYEVIVSNDGQITATNVVVTSALPDGFTPVESMVEEGSYNEESGYWRIPAIESGETVMLTMRGTVNTGQNNNSITAYANVRSYNQNDSDFSNNAANVVINVLDNVAPSITPFDDLIMDLNAVSPSIDFVVNDADVNANQLTTTVTSSDQSIVTDGNITISGGVSSNRSLVITPEHNQFGTVTISVTVDDGSCSATESFLLYVGNIWIGNTTNWEASSNWSTEVPTDLISAVIPENPAGGNFPVINNDTDVFNIIINQNANINVNAGRTLNVYGNFSNFSGNSTGNGTLRFRGPASQWLFGRIDGLIIDNLNNVTLANNLITERSINLQNGQLIVGDHVLFIKNPVIGTPQNLIMDGTSSLVVGGTSAGITLPSTITALEDLELNNGSGMTVNNDLQIGDSLKLYTGNFAIAGNSLTLQGKSISTGGTISSVNGASISVTSSGNAGNLIYDSDNNELAELSINVPNGSFEIENPVVVNTALNLVSGKLRSTSGMINVNNSAQNALIVSSESHIVGMLRRAVVAGINYELPVGTMDFKQSVNLSFNSMSASTSIDVTFNDNSSDPSFADISALNLEVGGNLVEQVLDYGFWTITPTNASGTYNYNISVTSQGHANGNEVGNHVLVKRENSSTSWDILGDYSATNEGGDFTNPITVSRANLTGFSDFAVGASSMGPLPVELTKFQAEQKQNGVTLEWTTASERNNSHFEVQKSSDGNHFETIGLVQGNGDSSSDIEYNFRDYSTHGAVSYYRLQQFDFDGQYDFSDVVKVEFESKLSNVMLYPNPALNNIMINFEKEVGQTIVHFVNTKGQTVQKETFSEGRSFELNISDLMAGYYQVIIWSQTKDGLISSNAKLLKE